MLALVISRVIRPASKLSTRAAWPDTTLGVDLGVVDASTDEIYAGWTGWPPPGRDRTQLAAKHLAPEVNQAGWRCLT